MSWHFLERWIEKVNHHSTLIGKFWITFLIVWRLVIVASVGDRVYSDEQSEFKCNTLQPGCTNVCFNKFSPISHLRFWSFQILLVAAPSVMFVIYSGHDQKKPKPKTKKTKKRSATQTQARRRRIQQQDMPKNWNSNANNNNNCDERTKKSSKSSSSRVSNRQIENNDSLSRDRREKETPSRQNGNAGTRSQTPQVMATLINYKNAGNPVEASVINGDKKSKKPSNVPWQEMRWNSLMHVSESGQKNGKSDTLSKTMWKKPKNKYRSKEMLNEKHINAELVVWGTPSSDDDNRNGKSRKVNQSSLAEADMYQNGIEQDFEKEQLAMMDAQIPPEYPGNDQWPQSDFDQKFLHEDSRKRKKEFRFPQIDIVKTRTKKARFTRHFNFYLLSVFARLLIEIGFLLMQITLYGFTVPALYKCEQWPCPNKVDCFISRPMEKTIFLYFMLIYTCICILLNACELKYLIWVYLFGRPKLIAKMTCAEDGNCGPNVIYDANGEPKYTTRLLDQDSDFDDCDSAVLEEEEEYEALMQNGLGMENGYRNRQAGYDNGRERGKAHAFRAERNGKYRDRHDKMAELRHRELDLILNAEEMQDDYDYDATANDPVQDMMQMNDCGGGSPGGGGDDYNC